VGIYFLVKKSRVLLAHDDKSAYFPSPYLDSHGEEDIGLRRGKPLFLNEMKYQELKKLYRNHKICREVSKRRQGEGHGGPERGITIKYGYY